MAKYTNESGGFLVLPDGREIAAGQDVDIAGDDEKNVAVKQWIAEDKLVKASGKSDK